MSEHPTYEYAQVIAGTVFRGFGEMPMGFLSVVDLHGDTIDAEFSGGFIEALNRQGSQGWRLISEQAPTEATRGWLATKLKARDNRVETNSLIAKEYLMMRQVQD